MSLSEGFILPLFEGQMIHCVVLQDDSVMLHHTQYGDPLHVTGAFADALCSLRSGEREIVRLKQMERMYPYLQGLSRCMPESPEPQSLLLGHALGMLFVELTSRCNERCLHCYAESSPERNDFLSFEEIQQSLRQARMLGRPFVQFTGGDPLIHRHLMDIVADAASLDFQGMEIYTNGLLLTDNLLSKLKPYRPRLSFSIYADCAETHDAITRVSGSWSKTLSAMQRAKAAGFEVRAGVVVMQENQDCVVNMPVFLQEKLGLRADQIRFDPVNSVGRGYVTSLPEHIQVAPSHAEKDEVRRGKLCIAANGDVYPCIFSRQLRLGNVREKSINEMLATLSYRSDDNDALSRWQNCQEQLSCSDCQMVACLLTQPAVGV